MTATSGILSTEGTVTAHGVVTARRAVPVKWWAGIGAAWIALIVVTWANWLLSGHAHPTPKGARPTSTATLVSVRTWEVLMVLGTIVVVYHVIWKPWRRERRLTFDGMMVIAFGFTWMIQDPLINYSRHWFNYNYEFVNLGCPQCHIPGWQTPNGHLMTEPLLFIWGMYFAVFLPWVMVSNWVMRTAKRRWPELGTLGTIGAALVVIMAIDFPLEVLWMFTKTYAYSGSIRWLTIFGGHSYQFPVYQALFGAAVVVGWGCLRYFKDDKGLSFAERGADRLKVSRRGNTGLRLLAVVGAVNTILFLTYSIPIQWFATHADDFPAEILRRPDLNNLMCGPGTDYACAGTRVPIPTGPDSAHLGPGGELRAPAGVPDQTGARP